MATKNGVFFAFFPLFSALLAPKKAMIVAFAGPIMA